MYKGYTKKQQLLSLSIFCILYQYFNYPSPEIQATLPA